MKRLGYFWYLDYQWDADDTPPGIQRALFIDPAIPLLSQDTIRRVAAKAPGSYWMIGGEPNVVETGNMTPVEYSRALNYYSSFIRQADPSARIVGPAVLNFDYTCNGCGDGYQSGHSWLDKFLATYRNMYGAEPPLDVWSIDSYDLNWNVLPLVNEKIITSQLVAFRQWLDSLPEQRGKPIWLAEFGVQWGYGDMLFKDGKAYSSGALREAEMKQFLVRLMTWLDEHSEEHKIEKWFIYSSHVKTFSWASVPSGIHLIDGYGPSSTLSSYGKVYHDLAQGHSVSP